MALSKHLDKLARCHLTVLEHNPSVLTVDIILDDSGCYISNLQSLFAEVRLHMRLQDIAVPVVSCRSNRQLHSFQPLSVEVYEIGILADVYVFIVILCQNLTQSILGPAFVVALDGNPCV